MANETVFTRYENNPIVTAKDCPCASTIFNSAVVPFGDGYAGVFRIDPQSYYSELHVGFSKDGLKWDINPEKIVFEIPDPDMPDVNNADNPCYDPRVIPLDGMYYVTWCNYPGTNAGPAMGLAKTSDFKKFELIDPIMLPFNRNAVLFPRKINGKYAILHRPSDTGHTPFGDIYYAQSDDLVHWGRHRFVFGATSGWQGTKIGAGPVPIETDEGWLVIYHGVRTTCSGFVYSVGSALLDIDKPWKTLYRTRDYVLAPTEDYERVGDVPNVVFPCAAIVDDSGKITLYYGGADTVLCVAYAQLDELIDFTKKHTA